MHCSLQAKTLRAQYSRGFWLRHPLYSPTTLRGYRRVPCCRLILHRCAAEPGKTVPAFGLSKGCGAAESGSPEAAEAPPRGPSACIGGYAALRAYRGSVDPPADAATPWAPRGVLATQDQDGRRRPPGETPPARRAVRRRGERLQRQARTETDEGIECRSAPITAGWSPARVTRPL